MTQPALDYFIRRGLVVKVESTENTDSGPTNVANGILLMNGASMTQFDKKERQIDRPFFTANTFAVANKNAYIEGDFEVFAPSAPGSGANQYPVCDVLLQCAGMATTLNATARTTTYNPITNSVPSATAYFWHTDLLLKVTGARNNISSLKMEIGSIFTGKVHLQGNYTNYTNQTLPAITTYNTIPVVCTYDVSMAGVTVPQGGTELALWAKSLEIVFGNKQASKEYTSTKKSTISDRKATWNMRIAKTLLSDFNPTAVRDACTIITGRMRTYETNVFGVMNGLYTEIGFRGQIDTVKEATIDDDIGWDISGNCVASSAGGDDFYVMFGNDTITMNTVFAPLVHGVTNLVPTFATGSKALVGTQTWSIVSGALPTGLSINAATGVITGTSSAGTFSWTVQVIDSNVPFPQVVQQVFTGIVLT